MQVLLLRLEIKQPENRLSINNWIINNNDTGLELNGRQTEQILLLVNATTRYLWSKGLAIF